MRLATVTTTCFAAVLALALASSIGQLLSSAAAQLQLALQLPGIAN